MLHLIRPLAVFLLLAVQGCLLVTIPLPAQADPSPAACPSVPDLPAGVEGAFAFDIRSPEILHFTSELAALATPDQKRVFGAALKAAGTPQERDAETAVAATCPTIDGIFGNVRAMAVIVNDWELPELDDKRFDDLSAVVDTAVEALAAGDALSVEARREALLPFAGTPIVSEVPVVPASAGGCAQTNSEARPIKLVQAKYPPMAMAAGTQGTVDIKVTLSDTGDVRSAEVFRQTLGDRPGAADVIRASILAAGTSTYAPEVINCRPISGKYLFKIRYGRG